MIDKTQMQRDIAGMFRKAATECITMGIDDLTDEQEAAQLKTTSEQMHRIAEALERSSW